MNQVTEAEGALAAMNRAAATARLRALRYGSQLAVWREGAVVLISPNENDPQPVCAEPPASRLVIESGERKNQ